MPKTLQVANHYPLSSQTILYDKRKEILDTSLKKMGNLGVLKMNREHRFNTLTPNYVKGLSRSIETLNLDEDVKLIYMVPYNGEHFSNGTDFRTILHHKKEQNYEKISKYLESLYQLQTQVAKINKPMMSLAPGHSFNSGATLLQASGYPLVTVDSKVCFNEVSFGFVPHGGATYYLSRMPGEIGTFLALTGLPLRGVDAKELHLADQIINSTKGYEEEIYELMLSLDMPIPGGEYISDRGSINPWRSHMYQKKTLEDERLTTESMAAKKKKHENVAFEDFYEPKDNIPSLTANSDLFHRRLMDDYNKANNPQLDKGYLEYGEGVHFNYYSYVISQIKDHTGHPYSKNLPHSFAKEIEAMNRCFYSNTIEEIMENLRKEGSYFSQQCLDKMEQNSLLSMKIALRMLREAKNKDFKGCLENEINVGLNKIQDKEFDLGISEILLKPSKGPQMNPGFSQKVLDEEVATFFTENKYSKEINVDIVKNALLPTRFYYEKYSDTLRLWINDESTTSPEVRNTFDIEVKEALREQGIDVRDRALTQESARNLLYRNEQLERRFGAYTENIGQMLRDKKLRDTYFDKLRAEVGKLDDKGEFYKLVNQKIEGVFEKAYLDKLNQVYQKGVEAQNLEKRRMYLRFKKFLLQSRIMTYIHEEADRQYKQVASLPFKEIHLTEKWDQTYRNQEHPDLQKSFLWHLGKAIGKVSLTPPELAKLYLQNPSQKKMMTLYTFDKKELEKLRNDVLTNPEKYEEILTAKDQLQYNDDDRFNNRISRRKEYEYWFEVINDGRIPYDSLPYYKEMVAYKQFVEDIEDRALNTLRSTVTRLILDFEENKGVNEIKEFEHKQGTSKAEAYRRLLKLVNDKDSEIKEKPQKKKLQNQEQPLVEVKKNSNEVRRIINNIVEQDKDISQMFQQKFQVKDNVLVSKFRDESLNTLYQLIEVALLGQRTSSLTKGDLEERLASILQAKNADKAKTSLRIIDAYLSEANSENLIKEAIRVVKPFYFYILNDALERESSKVLHAFKAETTGSEVLFYYMFNLQNPEVRSHPIVSRVHNFHEQREKEVYLNEIFKEQHPTTVLKELILNIGEVELDPSLSLAQKQQILDAQVKQQYENIQQFHKNEAEKEEQYHKDILNQQSQKLKKGFPHEYPEDEISATPEYNIYNYNPNDIKQINRFCEKADNTFDFLEEHEFEIQANYGIGDWLNVYANAINDCGLNMQAIFRESVDEDKYMATNYLSEAQSIFAGNRSLQWEDIATYAQYLKGFYEEASKLNFEDVQSNGDNLLELLISQMEQDNENTVEKVRQESVFELLTSKKYGINEIKVSGQRAERMKEEISDFKKLQERIAQNQKDKAEITKLLDQAPRNVQQDVKYIIDSPSKYINLDLLRQKLLSKDYSSISAKSLIDKDMFLKDITSDHSKSKLKDFLKNYHSIKLDVVSLAETRSLIEETKEAEFEQNQFKNQLKLVLDYVDESLRYISNDRRKEICLGDYLSRHHYLSSNSLKEFTNDILKNMITKVLGQSQDLKDTDFIDWEYAGVRTNPYTHDQQDKRVKQFNKDGQVIEAQSKIETQLDMIWQQKEPDFDKTGVETTNPVTGEDEVIDIKNYSYEEVLRDALDLTKLKNEMIPIKDFFENETIKIFTEPEFDQPTLEKIIQKYTEMRLKDCLLQKGFKEKLQTNNGHIYMKALKEQIADELKLAQPAVAQDLQYEVLKKEISTIYDIEGKYNMNEVNNLDAIGYDNLQKRFETSDEKQNRDLAHQTIFDKVLADYFLQKRGQYKKANELFEDLNKQFQGDIKYPDGHPSKSKDPLQVDPNKFTGFGEPGLGFQKIQQDIFKQDLPKITPNKFTSLMELDIATAQALQNGKNGLRDDHRVEIPEEVLKIPEYFEEFDPRKPTRLYVEDKLIELLEEIFDVRKNVEKTLSRTELIAYDKMLSQYLTYEALLPRLKNAIEKDYALIHQIGQVDEMNKEGKENEKIQYRKMTNYQAEENNTVQDENALYKFLSYSGMLEKKRREDVNKTSKDPDFAFGIHNFEQFYREQLEKDSRKKPREINPDDYKPKYIEEGQEFKTIAQKEADYFKDFELYKENKKEQQERIQLFFILEQFFSQVKENPDPMNKAKVAIEEYFKDSENTFFFDKNKIQ